MARAREQAPDPRPPARPSSSSPQACIEDIDYPPAASSTRPLLRQLATCRWIAEHQNVLITGATGIGKTYIACALAQQACRKGYRAFYRRGLAPLRRAPPRPRRRHLRPAPRQARAHRRPGPRRLGPRPATDQERRDLLEILEDRYGTRSTIITSQLPPAKWHDHLGDPTLADAICDRVLHNAHRLVLKGPSRRKEDKLDS